MNGDINEKQVLVGETAGPVKIDKNLKNPGFAADAAETGRRFEEVNKRLDELNPITAGGLSYDNYASGLESNTVQSALDEMSGKVADATSKVDEDLEEALSKIDTRLGEYMKVSDKPSGSYIGNGSSNKRTIEIGEKGSCLFVVSSIKHTFLIVSKIGGFCFRFSDNQTYLHSGMTINFEDGILTMESSSGDFNQINIEYEYQVL